MAYNPPTGSLVAFQSDPTKLVGTVSVVGNMNSSITAYQGGAWSTSVTGGYVNVIGSVLTVGSITALQGTNPWQVNMPSPSVIMYQAAGSILAVSATVNTGNSSVQILSGASSVWVIGGVSSVSQVGNWNINTINNPLPAGANFIGNIGGSVLANLNSGSVTALQGTNPWVHTNVGSIIAVQAGGFAITSLVSTIPSSVQVGASIMGTVPVTQVTNPWVVNVPTPSYIAYQLAGSVMAVNTTVTTGPSSVQLLSTSASIVTLVSNQLQGVSSVMLFGSTNASIAVLASQNTNPWVIGSIVGTYAEDAGANTNDKGLFVLHVRNDTMSSVTNADLDYSALSVGPVGEMLVANAPITKWFSQTASIMYGTSVQVVAPPGASIFSYITGIHVMNESANFSRVTFTQGLGAVAASILTRVSAPVTGGSNSNYINGIRVLDNNGISASISGVSSVLITITGFNAKT